VSGARDQVEDGGELSVAGALRPAAWSMADDFVRFVAGNVTWLAVAGGAVLVGRFAPPGYLLLLLVVAASLGLCRMAAIAVRGRPVRLQQFREGLTLRGWAGFGLGCLQSGLLALAVINVTIAWRVPTLPLVLSAVVSGYAAIFVTATILAVWPLLLDPARDHLAIGQIVRLGLATIAARPARQFALVMLEAVLVAVGLQTFVAALVLPGFGILLAAWVVLPLADELADRGHAVAM
jgi:hypothetical protein